MNFCLQRLDFLASFSLKAMQKAEKNDKLSSNKIQAKVVSFTAIIWLVTQCFSSLRKNCLKNSEIYPFVISSSTYSKNFFRQTARLEGNSIKPVLYWEQTEIICVCQRLSSCDHLIWHLEHCLAAWHLVRLKCQFTRPRTPLGNGHEPSVFNRKEGLFTKLIRQLICLSRYQTSSRKRNKMADKLLESCMHCEAITTSIAAWAVTFLAVKVL